MTQVVMHSEILAVVESEEVLRKLGIKVPNYTDNATAITMVTTRKFLNNLTPFLKPLVRSIAEADNNYRQLISYIHFWKVVNGVKKVFVYSREKGGGEDRLLGKTSIGIGGHVEWEELLKSSNIFEHRIPLYESLGASINRELREETGVEFLGDELPAFINIVQGHEDVDAMHLCINYGIEVHPDFEFNLAEKQLKGIGFMTLEEIGELPQLESWSRKLLPYI